MGYVVFCLLSKKALCFVWTSSFEPGAKKLLSFCTGLRFAQSIAADVAPVAHIAQTAEVLTFHNSPRGSSAVAVLENLEALSPGDDPFILRQHCCRETVGPR